MLRREGIRTIIHLPVANLGPLDWFAIFPDGMLSQH